MMFLGFTGAVILFISLTAYLSDGPVDKIQGQKPLSSQFNPWDGSHINLTEHIKNSMHDPDSYEHVETKYWEVGSGVIVVLTEFRGKNSFGAKVKQSIKAEVDLEGNILKVFE